MPKKISEITYRPPSEKEKILQHLRAHPQDGFRVAEIGFACGFLTKPDSLLDLAVIFLDAVAAQTQGEKREGHSAVCARIQKTLDELVSE